MPTRHEQTLGFQLNEFHANRTRRRLLFAILVNHMLGLYRYALELLDGRLLRRILLRDLRLLRYPTHHFKQAVFGIVKLINQLI